MVIIGSGGVVPALLYYLQSRLSCPIHIIGRNVEKLENLKSGNTFIYNIESFNLKVEKGFLINAIPANAKINWDNIINRIKGSPLYAMDLNYHLKVTKFLNYFNSSVKIKNGLDMLIYQALMSLDIWYNKKLSLSIDIEDLKKHLIEKYYDK